MVLKGANTVLKIEKDPSSKGSLAFLVGRNPRSRSCQSNQVL